MALSVGRKQAAPGRRSHSAWCVARQQWQGLLWHASKAATWWLPHLAQARASARQRGQAPRRPHVQSRVRAPPPHHVHAQHGQHGADDGLVLAAWDAKRACVHGCGVGGARRERCSSAGALATHDGVSPAWSVKRRHGALSRHSRSSRPEDDAKKSPRGSTSMSSECTPMLIATRGATAGTPAPRAAAAGAGCCCCAPSDSCALGSSLDASFDAPRLWTAITNGKQRAIEGGACDLRRGDDM